MQRRRANLSSYLLVACVLSAGVAVCGAPPAASAQQINPEEAALLLLNTARRGHNEGRCDFAVGQFREFIRLYPSHRDLRHAQYGLGLSLLGLSNPAPDNKAAAEALAPVASDGNFPDHHLARYYRAVALRAMGRQALADAAARPAEAAAIRAAAAGNFDEAARLFAAAADTFAARAKAAPPPDTQPAAGTALPADLDWLARCRCDQAEMFAWANPPRLKEIAALADGLLADRAIAASPYRPAAIYWLGYAKFGLSEYLPAGKALSQLAPFNQPFGPQARYLLARTHHLAGEAVEAATQYRAVLADFDAARKAAQQAVNNGPAMAALSPEQRAFTQNLASGPVPEHVIRATFYSGVLLIEQGKVPDAAAGMTAILQQYGKSSVAPEAQLRLGYCHLQTRNWAEAAKTLAPLADHPTLTDQARMFLARAQVGGADPANATTYGAALNGALEHLRIAAERAGGFAKTDPVAKVRRGDILIELGDTQQLARQFREAAATYQAALTENGNPDRAEEAMQRQAAALHLAGLFNDSDAVCQKFAQTYPKSLLLGPIAFRAAENAYLRAQAAAADPNARPDQVAAQFTEAAARYDKVIRQFPELDRLAIARQGLAACQYRLGKFADAAAALKGVADADRTGPLASVSYLQADCLIRTFPPEGADAIDAARFLEQAELAAKLLETYVAAAGSQPGAPPEPQLPDAMLKLGHCYQRIAVILADQAERQAKLTRAREIYDKLLQQFAGKAAIVPSAVFERAKCVALLGDPNGAANELGRFGADPLRASPVAPLAGLRQAALLRAMGRAPDAVNLLSGIRAQHEAALLKDPARADWAPALQYEHAVALLETGKPADARTILEALLKQTPDSPFAASATWRLGQIRRDELAGAIAAARAAANRPGIAPADLATAAKQIDALRTDLQKTAASLLAAADEHAKKARGGPAHLRMVYEAAWCSRVLVDAEIESARSKAQQDALAAATARIARTLTPGQAPPGLRPPDVPVSAIAVQPSEKPLREQYEKLIALAPDSPLANSARLELADLLSQRSDFAGAAANLATALERNPPGDLVEQLRLRLAIAMLAQNKPAAAIAQAALVGRNIDSSMHGPARLIEAEARLSTSDWAKAIELLTPFRDHPQLQTIANISDRALFRLGQAYAATTQPDGCRQAYSLLTQRFPQSPFFEEALYAIGQSYQQQKQHDNAVVNYTEVARRSSAEIAARAQLQMGLCRLEQGRPAEATRPLLAAAVGYDYPAVAAQARCEAARAYAELKQPDEARKLYQQVIEQSPGTPWADLAKKRLAELTPSDPRP